MNSFLPLKCSSEEGVGKKLLWDEMPLYVDGTFDLRNIVLK